MKTFVWMPACALVLVAACDDMGGMNGTARTGFLTEVPESVLALAAPYQNLDAVRVDPATRCYVYSYAGPVETTLLPLKTPDGRTICMGPEAAPAAS